MTKLPYMKKVLSWLQRPYSVSTNPIDRFLISFGLGVFIFLFLFIFQPFGINQSINNFTLYSLGFGSITFLVSYICQMLLFVLFKAHANDEMWTVGKNIFFLTCCVVSIAVCNYWYKLICSQILHFSAPISLSSTILNTLKIVVFPILIYMLYTEINFRKKREKIAVGIMESSNIPSNKNSDSDEITIRGDNKDEAIVFKINQLVYVSSEKNYTSFFLQTKKDTITEKVLRTTMTHVENDLAAYESIYRCHKSYIVNSQHVEKITGNARGYQFQIKTLAFPIPVSRNFSKSILSNLPIRH